MNSLGQRDMVAKSLLIPNHGVYPVREPKEAPKETIQTEDPQKSREKWPSPEVPKTDHGEW